MKKKKKVDDYKAPEEGQRVQKPKFCDYSNSQDKDTSLCASINNHSANIHPSIKTKILPLLARFQSNIQELFVMSGKVVN